MSQAAITVQNVSKQYRIGAAAPRYPTIRDAIVDAVALPFRRLRALRGTDAAASTMWALRDVDFQVQPGQVIGVIGRNGAGKSTLLKILSRITEPTAGRVRVRGRVASLLEVGTGFHIELTGRENVFLNGSILGMTRREIQARFDEIVAFADVERFLDTPVKRYSTGMFLRLAFAVAAHLETDILIVDEVLAVGDAAFQQKCMSKMGDVTQQGRTVLFVSHNMAAVEALCTEAVVLSAGRLAYEGPVKDAIRTYLRPAEAVVPDVGNRQDRQGNGKARIVGVRLLNQEGVESDAIFLGEDFYVELHTVGEVSKAFISVGVGNVYWKQAVRGYTWEQVASSIALTGEDVVRCRFRSFPLMHGCYDIHVQIEDWAATLDEVECAAQLTIHPRDVFGTGRAPDAAGGVAFCHAEWEVNGERYH